MNAIFYDIDDEVLTQVPVEDPPPDRYKLPFVRNGHRRWKLRPDAAPPDATIEAFEFELVDVHFEANLARYRRVG